MYTIDFFPVLIATIFILLYNPFMTAVFIGQRYKTETNIGSLSKRNFQLLIFVFVLVGQFAFTLLKDPGVWWIVYFITITILFIWDKITKRVNGRKQKKT
jgi:hypothetical protein